MRSAAGLLIFLSAKISQKVRALKSRWDERAGRSFEAVKMEDQTNRAHRKTREKKKHSGGNFSRVALPRAGILTALWRS